MEELFEVISISLRALRANKLRSALTMLGVIIGVASVIILVSIGSGLKNYITKEIESLGSNLLMVIPGELEIAPAGGGGGGVPGAGTAASKLTLKLADQLQKEGKTILRVMPYTENNGTMKYKNNSHITPVAGVSFEYPQIRNQKVSQGSFFSESQQNSAKRVAVLGRTVAEDLFDDEDPVEKIISVSDQKYTVLGVLEEKGAIGAFDQDDQVFIPVTAAMRQFGLEFVHAYWVESKSSETIAQTREEIEEILGKSLREDEFSAIDTKSLLSVVSRILGVLTLALAGIAAISLLVGGIGIMNIMLVSVTERTREIGLRKAVGATPGAILAQFLIEAIILSVGGGITGIILGSSTSLLLGRFLPVTITFWSILLAFGVSVIVGVIFGVAPAARASRLNPIDALRYE